MAFRMNRPMIKGTTHHKASIAKAKATSVVSQSRTKADAGLIAASNALGKSYKPSEIDFELDKINIDVPEKKKKEKQPKVKKEKTRKENLKEEYEREHPGGTLFPNDDGGYQYYDADGKLVSNKVYDKDGNEVKKERSKTGKNIVDGVKTVIGGIVGIPLAIGNGLFKFGDDIIDELGQKVEGAIEDIQTKGAKGKEKRAEKKAEKEAEKKAKEAAALAEQQAIEGAKFDELMAEDEEENDFSAIEAEPDVDYETSGAVDRGYKTWKHKQDAENIRSARETSGRMNTITEQRRQEAAKKHNVKVEDLEAKEIGGKKEFFPKQGVQGGSYILTEKELRDSGQVDEDGNVIEDKGTKWDDELGRFRVPTGGISDEALANLPDEDKKVYEAEMEERAKKAVTEAEAFKPKQDNIKPEDLGDLPSMINSGDIALDPVTNQYEYTDQYIKRNQPKVEPVVEEKKTLSNLEIRKKKMADKKWNDPNTSQYIKDQMLKEGYVPDEGKTAMKMRDNRIYRNAVKGGTVQQNMIKSGYIPE